MIYMDSFGKIKKKRCKEVDFVFVYEVKNREIQGISLIGYELIKRGYTVGYVNTWHGLHHDDIRYRAKVAVVFEAYNTDVIGFALSFIEHCDNVFNMQWEQILNDTCLADNSPYILRGDATRVYHAAWGEVNKRHLIDVCHIPAEHVKVVGHIGMDFVSQQFEGYYKSKNEICREYGLDNSKQIVLFISSFCPPQLLEKDWADFNIRSKEKISEWLIRYSRENPDKYVIYRPHPTETSSDDVKLNMERSGIQIIREYSVQQWILIADKVLNWWSTSLADIHAAGKTCVFLRPYRIPDKDEYHIFRNIEMATTYEEMLEHIESNSSNISEEEFGKYYYFDENEPVYKRLVDVLENIINSKTEYLYNNEKSILFKEKAIIIEMREIFGYIKSFIQYKMGKKNSFNEIRYHLVMAREQYISEKRIMKLMKTIRAFS